jgi:endonuclease/exonuclease/phosphatase (EEP) superfamily protein YafD
VREVTLIPNPPRFTPPRTKRYQALSIRVIQLLAGFAAIGTGLGFAGQVWWGFSLLEHPRPQYAFMLLIALLVGFVNRKPMEQKRWQWLWLLPLMVNLGLMSSTGKPIQPPLSQPPLQVAHLTLDHEQTNTQPAIDYLERLNADLVSVLEVTPSTLAQLQAGLKHYQLVAAEPRSNSHGSAWFIATNPSQTIRLIGSQIIHLPAASARPILETTVQIHRRKIVLLCFHAIRPQSQDRLAYQVEEFAALSRWSQAKIAQQQALIVVGDFNDTPWSTRFRQLLAESGLQLAKPSWGVHPTWPTGLPEFLRIPIDHGLLSPNLAAHKYQVGQAINSDHAPIVMDLLVTELQPG